MDFNSVGRALKTAKVDMQLKSPDGFQLFAYEHPELGWQLTTESEIDGKPTNPSVFHMVGQDSKEFRQRTAELFKLGQKGRKYDFSEAELEGLKTIMAPITGWEYIPWKDDPTDETEKARLLEFNEKNLALFLQRYQPAKTQSSEFVADRANFYSSAKAV
jgi:hypothetical protein